MSKRTPKQLIKRYEDFKSSRGTLESHLQEIADLMLPNKNDITVERTPGEKRNVQIFDSTGMQSAESFAGSCSSLLTNPQSMWFELFTGVASIDDRDDVRLFNQQTQRKILDTLNNSNFNTEINELYRDDVTLGTSAIYIEEDDEYDVRFCTKPVSRFVISENNKGRVDEIYFCFKWNIRNIVAEFGEKILEIDEFKKAYEKDSEHCYEIIHGIYPNTEKSGPLSVFSYISQYVLKDKQIELRASGYHEWPVPVVRFSKAPGEWYGRCPGMTALPDVKTLNEMMKQTLKAAAKTIDPPLSIPDDGYLLPLKTQPGGFNFYRPGFEPIQPLLGSAVNLNPQFNFDVLNRISMNIKNAFYLNVLQLAESDRMTTVEVNARLEQQIRVLGPLVGRMQDELLGPLIFRVFKILQRRGKIAPVPEAIASVGGLQVRYSGPLAKAQRMSQTNDLLRTVELLAPVVNIDPSVVDNIDGDEYLREVVRLQNFPQQAIRKKEQVAAIRRDRAEKNAQDQAMAQQQLAAEQAGQIAPALKVISG